MALALAAWLAVVGRSGAELRCWRRCWRFGDGGVSWLGVGRWARRSRIVGRKLGTRSRIVAVDRGWGKWVVVVVWAARLGRPGL